VPKTATIRLGETDYEIRQFKIGELEKIMQTFQDEPPVKVPFAVLRLAMSASAKIDVNDLTASAEQIGAAFLAIMGLNGLKGAKPGEAIQGAA
jgi:hypothetical protein